MRSKFPTSAIIKDYGSGINFKRKGLQTVLERVMREDKHRIIVAHRDRLAQFGGEVVVLDQTVHSPEEEFTADLLAILHLFSRRMHELWRYCNQIQEDSNQTHKGTESDS